MYHYCKLNLGFSFGGILARYLTAKLWDSQLLSSTDLLQNVACITFGIPLIPVANIQKIGKKYPDLQKTFYSFFLSNDILPTLLSFRVYDEKVCKKLLILKLLLLINLLLGE